MAQWGQGYQYPLQTGYNPQQFQQQGFPQSAGGIAPQPTGYPGQPQLQQQRPAGFQQPQPTGYPGAVAGGFQQPQGSGFAPQPTGFQPQPTGFPGAAFQQQQQQRPPPPPVPPIPAQYQQNAPSSNFLAGPPPQVNRFLSSSPGPSLTAQPTGFPGAGGPMRPLVAQPTGIMDPRLQMMSSQFLPANPTAPYSAGGAPQLQLQPQGGISLQQSFMQHNQARGISTTPKIPWTLNKAEKKSYDQIFRAWDQRGEGFITGQTALEVFGQSGLDKNDLAKIWSLADVDNRGKLNLAEFYVAMGLIYRRLNGNEIPEVLPQEMIPPSAKDLDDSVDFLKRVLQNDSRARSPSNFDTNAPISRLKDRSFNSTSVPGAGSRQDATVYKYTDESPPGGFYQSRSRHIDRSAIRTQSDRDSPSSDLDEMKRQLENTAKMLDKTASENAARTAEDDKLEREMDDLKYRVKRLQEDLEYVSRGPRSVSKDDERRKLERELMGLLHEKLPELERRIKDREERKKREQREWDADRDRRNERFGRFRDRDEDTYSSRYGRDDDRDRYRSYDRDRERDRERDRDRESDWDRDRARDREYDRDRPYSRNRDRDHDRPRSPPARSTPPPAPTPPTAPPPSSAPKPPPSASPAPNTKNMTPEERRAFIQAEAQRRTQARMLALGVVSPGVGSPKLDTSVEDRLAKEKEEAEEKARQAEKEAEERARVREERLRGEKGLKDGVSSPVKEEPPKTATSCPDQVCHEGCTTTSET